MVSLFVHRRLPKTPSEWVSFLFVLFGVHGVLIFEIFVVLPFIYDGHHDSTIMYYTHIAAALFIYFNTMANIVLVMVTETGIRGIVLPSVLKEGWRFCPTCECNAPPRSRHCWHCKTCVLKRDHHCVFTGCCVGHANQRYFLLMILYIWAASLYACLMNVDFVYHLFGGEITLKTAFVLIMPLLAWMFQLVEAVDMTFAFMTSLCLIVFLMTSALLGYHMMNVVNGQTVHDRRGKERRYDLGLVRNLKVVFGERWSLGWLCPLIASPPVGDGLEFVERSGFETEKDR